MPYEDDWIDLINYLGNANVAGGKMKDTSLQYWKSPNLSATNESGFSGLPGGQRNSNGSFEYLTETGRWWCFEDVYETPDNRLTWFPDHDDTFIISPSIFFFIMGITDLQQ